MRTGWPRSWEAAGLMTFPQCEATLTSMSEDAVRDHNEDHPPKRDGAPAPRGRLRRFAAGAWTYLLGWFGVSGFIASTTTCPYCGNAGCPVGIGQAAGLGLFATAVIWLFGRKKSGDRRQNTGDRIQETGDRRQETEDSSQWSVVSGQSTVNRSPSTTDRQPSAVNR